MILKGVKICCLLLPFALSATGCARNPAPEKPPANPAGQEQPPSQASEIQAKGLPFEFQVTPEDFSLSMQVEGKTLPISASSERRAVEGYEEHEGGMSWRYPDARVTVSVEPSDGYLSVTIASDVGEDNDFTWPSVAAEDYYFPFGEGKHVPADSQDWKDYLDGRQFTVMEELSMPFWSSVYGDYAVLCLMENPYRTQMEFVSEPSIGFSIRHEYPAIDEDRTNRFRIYATENNPTSIAKIYRDYVKEQGRFLTLEEKAEKNPDIRKLYGAPHIYLHGDLAISPDDIDWPAFRKALGTPLMQHIKSFAGKMEGGEEAAAIFQEIAGQDYVAEYQKNTICLYLSSLLKRDDFYSPNLFPKSSPSMEELLKDGYKDLSPASQVRLNQHALAENMADVFSPADTWLDGETLDLLKSMDEAGIHQAWIGLNSWEQAYQKPELVRQAADQGYLIGAYDSYHSIHEPGNEQWITAKFPDSSLYEDATITDKDGEKQKGFKGVGRKLNPVLALPAVKARMEEIMGSGLPFNSWFIDCDAFGEIYDDYSADHITTQQEDLAARMERLAYIRDTYGLVVGSEGGNDFAAQTLAFAHGIELKSFSWMDEDMNRNKDSEYYIGRYYNPNGGVAEHFSKRIPLKEPYASVFLNPRYDAPLFKLVYHDSVITSYHWDWSTFKVQGATRDRMVREVLYDVPPLYHLDSTEWERYGEDIARHHAVWSEFSKKAITQEMTDFAYLSEDGAVQKTVYGGTLSAVANFSDAPYQYGEEEIPAHSVLIEEDGASTIYTPIVQEDNA